MANEGNETLYQKVKADIRDSLTKLPLNTKIPTRNQLSADYNVARTTIDRAISELIGEGFLYSKVGSGTYVVNNSGQNNVKPALADSIWGFLLPSVTDYSFPEMIRGAEDVCSEANINLILCNTDKSFEKQNNYIDNLVAIGVKGILAVTSIDDSLAAQNRFSELVESGIKVVFCTGGNQSLRIPKVITNDFSVAEIAVSHIIDMGWKKPAFISKVYFQPTEHRYAGYLNALSKYGIAPDKRHICLACEESPDDSLYFRVRKMLELPDPPDSAFCFNDEAAAEVYKAVTDSGLVVGKDFGIIGCDNTSLCEELSPSLSSIKQPFYEIGKNAAKTLLKMTSTQSFPEERIIILEPELVARDSLGTGKR